MLGWEALGLLSRQLVQLQENLPVFQEPHGKGIAGLMAFERFSVTVRYTSSSTDYRQIWSNTGTHFSNIWFKPLWYLNQETLRGIPKLWIQLRSMLAVQLWCTLTIKCLVGSTPSSWSLANMLYLEDLSHQRIQPEAKLGIIYFPSCNQMPESTCLKTFLVSFSLSHPTPFAQDSTLWFACSKVYSWPV